MVTYVEYAVDGTAVLVERRGVDEERGHKVHGVRASELAGELGSPALGNRPLSERASFAREGRGEDAAIVLELVRVIGICRDVGAKSGRVRGRTARERAKLSEHKYS